MYLIIKQFEIDETFPWQIPGNSAQNIHFIVQMSLQQRKTSKYKKPKRKFKWDGLAGKFMLGLACWEMKCWYYETWNLSLTQWGNLRWDSGAMSDRET